MLPGRDRRHRLRPPGPRALRHRPRVDRRHRAASGPPQFKVVIDYAFGSTSFAMPNVLAKLGARGAGRQPLRLHRRAAARRRRRSTPRSVADLVRASGSHLGAVLDPDGEHLTLIDDEGHVLTDTEALLAFLDAAARQARSATGSPCRCRPPARPPSDRRRATASRSVDQAVQPGADGRGHRARRRLRRQRRRRLHPPGLPARLRRGRHASSRCSTCWPSTAGGCPTWWPTLPSRPPRPRGGRDPVGAEGHGHAHAWSSRARTARSSWSTASRSSTTTAGPWRCPIRRSR